MDGRNSFGRRISLLNEASEVESSKRRADISSSGARPLAFHTRHQSYAPSPNSSPPTPELVRSDSSDSSNMNRTPSPTTPTSQYDFGSLADSTKQADALFAHNAFFSPQHSQQDPSNYPPIPQHAAQFTYPAPPSIAPQPSSLYQQSAPPLPPSEQDSLSGPPQPSSSSTAASSKGGTKKNSYPCPLAKQYGCTDYFTTSGHAARHAKKHTGKKDAFCPECNKAFTRKDNMEQHRRTHQNGRSSNKSSGEGPAKRQKTSQPSKRSTMSEQQPALPMQPAMSSLDPSLAHSPASSYGGYPEPAFAPNITVQQSYPLDMLTTSPFANGPYQTMSSLYDPALGSVNSGSTGGLDALAIAAAKRDENF